MVIGSGPIIIGQAAEFDYAGTQACKSLREEGIFTILINSNPATIMTDKDIADTIYIEPLTVEVITRIIEKEQPDGILPTLGGQTALNLAVKLHDEGILKKYNVALLGTPVETIKNSEDRDLFRSLLIKINEPVLPSQIVSTVEEANKVALDIGMPLIVRPAYTLGGTGGGIVNNINSLKSTVQNGLNASPINQVLLERYLKGWKEVEYEVIRDSNNNCITVCNMENFDPMGVHTGDSIVVAPSQTLTDKEYQMLRSASIKIIRELNIQGGCNVQFALHPGEIIRKSLDKNEEESPYYVIEVNPRVSRSSALASKATGYPIARVAAKIAIGKTLDEIKNQVTGQTSAAFEPALDYCVVKIPRFPFDKFPEADRTIGTQMKATGEVMAIGRSFESAIQKAIRSLEIPGASLLWEDQDWHTLNNKEILALLSKNVSDKRLWLVITALRRGISPKDVSIKTGIDPWFTFSISNIIKAEKTITSSVIDKELLKNIKSLGFSDKDISILKNVPQSDIRKLRTKWNIFPTYKMVDTCAAEFPAQTPYFYSTYEEENEAFPLEKRKALVIGSGPIRIGQGIEFDYCSVHAAWSFQNNDIASIMVNSNPETVSTDFDTSSRLYFEPLDEESIQDIISLESANLTDSTSVSTVVQFGGQTAINLSQPLNESKLPILGTSAESTNIASDRDSFEKFLKSTNIPSPPGYSIYTTEEAVSAAKKIGYPVVVRPSYVLGGRAMKIIYDEKYLKKYMKQIIGSIENNKILIDKYIYGKEIEVDAVSDGENVLIPGIMEHIEKAGVHSGDSIAVYPTVSISQDEIDTIVEYTTLIGKKLKITGLMNIQYVIYKPNPNEPSIIYIIEVNPRSSRTIPFISKVTNIPMVKIAIENMLGKTLKDLGLTPGLQKASNTFAVKAPVFSMSKLIGVDTELGPEMKSTGEVMGIDYDLKFALKKAIISAGLTMPEKGSILLSVADKDKEEAISIFTTLHSIGYHLYATDGTASLIKSLGIPVTTISRRLDREHPNVLDVILNNTVDAVINTVTGSRDVLMDGFYIRRAAVDKKIPCFTSIDTAKAAIDALSNTSEYSIKPLNKYLNKYP